MHNVYIDEQAVIYNFLFSKQTEIFNHIINKNDTIRLLFRQFSWPIRKAPFKASLYKCWSKYYLIRNNITIHDIFFLIITDFVLILLTTRRNPHVGHNIMTLSDHMHSTPNCGCSWFLLNCFVELVSLSSCIRCSDWGPVSFE